MSEAPGTIDVAPITDPLETIAGRGFSRYDVYRDWVELMLAALQRDDETYLDVLDDYDRGKDRDRDERNADLFSTAFGELMSAMEASNRDVLGVTYEAFGMQNEAFGQHFTPHNVCASLAELQATSGDPEPPITIADPACGSGRLLIHAARRHDARTICFGQDKDLLCAQMAALNCCFFNMDAVVMYGDSLTLEQRRAWRTEHRIMGGGIAEADPESVPWPEAAFESTSTPTADAGADGATDAADATDRVTVETDGGSVDQADLDDWLQ